jgi:hypothetical protein
MVTFDWKHALKLLLHTLSTTLISTLHDSIPNKQKQKQSSNRQKKKMWIIETLDIPT